MTAPSRRMTQAGMDWLWCANCEEVCRVWDRSVGVSDVVEMLSLHRYWRCQPLSREEE